MTSQLVRGEYVDPSAGRTTFEDFAGRWLASQTFDDPTRESTEARLRNHILPTFGALELRAIRPSAVQAWLRDRQELCAASTVKTMATNLAAILGAAVEDGLIARNPCASRSVRAPKVARQKVVPWTVESVGAVVDAHPEAWRAAPMLAAGCGLRQGEVLGVRVEDVDFLGRRLLVRQQVRLINGRPQIALPKGRKTREVPLPDAVAFALSEHLTAGTSGLLFMSSDGEPVRRTTYNQQVWKPALRAAGVEPRRENGMHALRHFFASVQLEAGTSIRALAEYLGHHDPGFTLRIYTHLMPASEERARAAMDAAFGNLADSPRTKAAN